MEVNVEQSEWKAALEDLGLTEEQAFERICKYPETLKLQTRIPYGYIKTEKKEGDRLSTLVLDPVVILYLDVALDRLDSGTTYVEAVDFMNKKLRVSLTSMGLKNLRLRYRPETLNLAPRKAVFKKRMTREERSQAIKRKKLLAAKRKASSLKRQVEILEEQESDANQVLEELQNPVIEISSSMDYSELGGEEENTYIYNPTPKQELFHKASQTQVLYGGSAGGGKSYALLADAARFFHIPKFNGLILRRTLDELRELIKESRFLYKSLYPEAKWNQQEKTWKFPSGATLWMSYLDREEDAEKYRGQSFCWIGFDELTQWGTPFAWNFLYSRLRSTDPILSANLAMRATSNPGGIGHGWVKKMFIDPAPPGEPFWAKDLDTDETILYPEDYRIKELAGKPLFKRRFIPANLYDNKYLMEDGNYERNLLSLPEQQRRQLLEGDWDVADGAAFSEFRLNIHTCEPFEVPPSWRRFRSCDWGYSTRQWTAVHWFAIAPDDTLYVYRELYVNQKTAREVAYMIKQIEAKEIISYGVLDANAWNKTGQSGPSIAEEMIKVGCRWRPADNKIQNSRPAGANRLHQVLRIDEGTKKPGIIFFNTCRKIISSLPVIPQDPNGSDDIDKDYADDHAYDSVRYGVMSRPKASVPWESGATKSPTRTNMTRYRALDPVFGY